MSDAPTESGCSYRIRIKGHLDARWARWFVGLRPRGLEIAQLPEGDTLLSGSGIDQAALHDIPATERPTIVAALARKLKSGGRLIVREPQGERLARDELEQLAITSDLWSAGFIAHKVFIGAVFDAMFTHP